jgi:hypothetical protein
MRAKEPKVSVSSVRVGPSQESAIGPPQGTRGRGDKEAGSEWHGNDNGQVKRQAAVKKNHRKQHNDEEEA